MLILITVYYIKPAQKSSQPASGVNSTQQATQHSTNNEDNNSQLYNTYPQPTQQRHANQPPFQQNHQDLVTLHKYIKYLVYVCVNIL